MTLLLYSLEVSISSGNPYDTATGDIDPVCPYCNGVFVEKLGQQLEEFIDMTGSSNSVTSGSSSSSSHGGYIRLSDDNEVSDGAPVANQSSSAYADIEMTDASVPTWDLDNFIQDTVSNIQSASENIGRMVDQQSFQTATEGTTVAPSGGIDHGANTRNNSVPSIPPPEPVPTVPTQNPNDPITSFIHSLLGVGDGTDGGMDGGSTQVFTLGPLGSGMNVRNIGHGEDIADILHHILMNETSHRHVKATKEAIKKHCRKHHLRSQEDVTKYCSERASPSIFESTSSVVVGDESDGGNVTSQNGVPETNVAIKSCPITQSEFQVGDVIMRIHCCHSVFSRDSLMSWLSSNNTCPVCRTELT